MTSTILILEPWGNGVPAPAFLQEIPKLLSSGSSSNERQGKAHLLTVENLPTMPLAAIAMQMKMDYRLKLVNSYAYVVGGLRGRQVHSEEFIQSLTRPPLSRVFLPPTTFHYR